MIDIDTTKISDIAQYEIQSVEDHFDSKSQDAIACEIIMQNDHSIMPENFFIDDGWLKYQPKADKKGNAPAPIKICSQLFVSARTRDQNNENHGRLLEFPDLDKIIHKWAMPMELLAGDGTLYRQELLSKGLLIAPGASARQLLTMYIQTACPKYSIRGVQQTGWNPERTAYVLPKETIGAPKGEQLILQSTTDYTKEYSSSGTLQDWLQIAKICNGNTRLIFAISYSFAAPLVRLIGLESGGVNFYGTSSTGKTTCLYVAASVWGGPSSVHQWRTTINGLEGIAVAHNDGLLCLDELGQMNPHEIGSAVYMIANGRGKSRADKNGNARRQYTWTLQFLSSAEITLSSHMQEANQKARAGHEIRILDVPAFDKQYGCFEELHSSSNGKEFADNIKDLATKFYGTAGREFLKILIPRLDEACETVQKTMKELSKTIIPGDASSQVHRAFNRFALTAAVGELATTFGLTGWQKGTAINAAVACYNDWLNARGILGPKEDHAIISQIRHFFQQCAESRFSSWNNDYEDSTKPQNLPRTLNRAGFRKRTAHGDEFYVYLQTFRGEICKGYESRYVEKLCIKMELLMPDTNGNPTRSERLPGHSTNNRVYRFTPKILEDQ